MGDAGDVSRRRQVCRSAPWCAFANRVVLPGALADEQVASPLLETGGGSGVMAAGLARAIPEAQLTVTDLYEDMAASARQLLARHPNVQVRTADVTVMPSGTRASALWSPS